MGQPDYATRFLSYRHSVYVTQFPYKMRYRVENFLDGPSDQASPDVDFFCPHLKLKVKESEKDEEMLIE